MKCTSGEQIEGTKPRVCLRSLPEHLTPRPPLWGKVWDRAGLLSLHAAQGALQAPEKQEADLAFLFSDSQPPAARILHVQPRMGKLGASSGIWDCAELPPRAPAPRDSCGTDTATGIWEERSSRTS